MINLFEGNYWNNSKAKVILRDNLSESQKQDAYKIMGFVYMPAFYSRNNTCEVSQAKELLRKAYISDYDVIHVMY